MKLPELKNPKRYQGLYVFDFGDHSGVGFTGEEVAELLESEKFKHGKVYRIYRAYPDGTLELTGVSSDIFELEAGMFFYAGDRDTAHSDYKRLVSVSVRYAPPCRAKLQLARLDEGRYVTALIYPAEYDQDVSRWLLDNSYKTTGEVQGGVNAVSGYYASGADILERHQLFGRNSFENRTGKELLEGAKKLVLQR